jgi:arylsulfatase A-like enzyme
MTRPQQATLRLITQLGVALIAPLALADQPPNVVFIFTDDQGWGDVAAFGHPHVQTPHLDALARGGMRLTQFYVMSPVCSPSRAALITGRFAAETGVHYAIGGEAGTRYNSVPWLDPELPTVYDAFGAAGYVTGHYGKWHVGHRGPAGEAPPPAEYGIQVSGTTHSTGPGMVRHGERMTNGNKSELIANRAEEFIAAHSERPFYLNLWFHDPHAVLEPSVEQMEPYLEHSAVWGNRTQVMEMPSSLTVYYAILSNIDRAVGRVVAALEQAGVRDNTIIVFSSDNGPSPLWSRNTGHAGAGLAGPFRGTKASLYEGGIRVPFIIQWPGRVPANQVDDTSVVAAVDMFPTLAALAGVPLPVGAQLSGLDRSAVMRGNPQPRTAPLFWEYRFGNWGRDIDKSPRLAIRDGDWKLLMNPDGSRKELYNLARDHSETENAARYEPEVLSQLEGQLMRWFGERVPDPDKAPPFAGRKAWRMPQSGDL